MKINKSFAYGFLFLINLCFTACESSLPSIIGEYSFKLSGQVIKDTTQGIVLPPEIGTMEIIHRNDNNFRLTFNTINGDVYTTNATLSDNQLDLQPFTRTITITYHAQDSDILGGLIEWTETEHYNTEVYGYGTVYGQTIEFTMQYSGKELDGNKQIKGNNIIMIAKKN